MSKKLKNTLLAFGSSLLIQAPAMATDQPEGMNKRKPSTQQTEKTVQDDVSLTEDTGKPSPKKTISRMPPEVWAHIASFADNASIAHIAGTDKEKRNYFSKPKVIEELKRKLYVEPEIDENGEYKTVSQVLGELSEDFREEINDADVKKKYGDGIFKDKLADGYEVVIKDKSITDDDLKHLKNVKHLDLSGCRNITDAGLKHLSENLTNLQSLNLSHCHHITDEGLKDLAKYLTNLTHLDLSWCIKITDEGLEILTNLIKLQILNLTWCDKITDEAIKNLPQNLKSLNLSDCRKITDEGLKKLEKLTKLQNLDLSGCYEITDAGLKHLSEKLTKLQSLDLWAGGNITYSAKQSLRDRGVRVS